MALRKLDVHQAFTTFSFIFLIIAPSSMSLFSFRLWVQSGLVVISVLRTLTSGILLLCLMFPACLMFLLCLVLMAWLRCCIMWWASAVLDNNSQVQDEWRKPPTILISTKHRPHQATCLIFWTWEIALFCSENLMFISTLICLWRHLSVSFVQTCSFTHSSSCCCKEILADFLNDRRNRVRKIQTRCSVWVSSSKFYWTIQEALLISD